MNCNCFVWFEVGTCPLPLCRYPNKRHEHLTDTLRMYQRIMESDMPFMGFYNRELYNASRSELRRRNRRNRNARSHG